MDVAWAGVAQAAPNSGSPTGSKAIARAKYKVAERLVAAGSPEEALVVIEEGLASAPADLLLLRLKGSVLMTLHRLPEALAAYQAYLAAGATGAKKRQVEELVQELRPILTTFLDITVTNGPAQVYVPVIGKALFCTASPSCSKAPMLPRVYQIVVERVGFERWTGRANVAAGQTATLAITLIEKPSPLTVRVTPPDARITVDDSVYDPGAKIAAGPHAVRVSLAGFTEARRTINAHQGQPVELDVALAAVPPTPAKPPSAAPGVALAVATPPPARSRFTTRRKIALAAGGAGVVGLAAGIILGLEANQLERDAFAICPSASTPCGPAATATERNRSARSRAFQANVAYGIGSIGAIAAAILAFTGARESRLAITPMVSAPMVGAVAGIDVAASF